MPVGAPGANSRGRGGKFRNYTRGGGKHFSRDLQPIDGEGNPVSMWSAEARKRDSDDDSEEESESEEDSEEEEEGESAQAAARREDRKAQKKARKEAAIAKQKAKTVEVGDMPSSDDSDDDLPANPNHSSAAREQATKGATVAEITEGVKKLPASRREREAVEAAAAKERYMKLHAQGKTDEAKADLARLKVIREQREAEAARRQAEKEEREEREKLRRTETEVKEAKKREAAAAPKKTGKKK